DQARTLLRKSPERVLVKEHNLENEGRVRFDEDARRWRFEGGSGFDVKTYLPKLKAAEGEAQRHYELRLYVSATDNNAETGPRKGPGRGPFTFLVVSENELIAEISKQELKLYNLLKEAVDTLDGRKASLEADLIKLDSAQPDLNLLAVRSDQAHKAV